MELQAQNMFCACSFHGNSMNNLFSFCGLVDAGISASEKDLPVNKCFFCNSLALKRVFGE